MSGTTYPSEYNGHRIVPLSSQSLLPILRGEERVPHEYLGFEHEGGRALRQGDWKSAALKGKPWELFHLKEDRTETRDLAAANPEKLQALSCLWEQWAKKVGAPR